MMVYALGTRIGLKGTHLCEKVRGERWPTPHEWEKESNDLRASPMAASQGKSEEREGGEGGVLQWLARSKHLVGRLTGPCGLLFDFLNIFLISFSFF